MVLLDDFSTGTGNFTETSGAATTATVNAGRLELSGFGATINRWIYNTPAAGADHAVDALIQSQSNNNNSEMGLIVRRADDNNYVYARIDGQGRAQMYNVTAGTASRVGSLILFEVDVATTAQTMTLTVAGDSFTVSCAGQSSTQTITDTSGLGVGIWMRTRFNVGSWVDDFGGTNIGGGPPARVQGAAIGDTLIDGIALGDTVMAGMAIGDTVIWEAT